MSDLEKTVTMERLAFGGEGVGRVDGKVIFVPWTVPGDQVRVRVVSDHGRYERGELIEILQPSSDRVEPLCSVFGKCGGCQWQNVRYDVQLKMKEAILRDSLQRVGGFKEPLILPIMAAVDPWHYRHRIQLKVDPHGIGFHAFRSHEVVPFEECFIADSRLNEAVQKIRLQALPEKPFELSLNTNGEVVSHEFEQDHREGEGIFSQANRLQNENLVRTVFDFSFGKAELAFTKKKTVVELYAGDGNFTFPIAERAGRVIAVEANQEAVERGEAQSLERGVHHIEWIVGNAEWGLKKIYRKKIVADLLILDPPRHGAREILDLIPLLKPRTVIYVSCDPLTLSRDLKLLCRRHYRLEKVQPIDMFPQTYHLESVAQLTLV